MAMTAGTPGFCAPEIMAAPRVRQPAPAARIMLVFISTSSTAITFFSPGRFSLKACSTLLQVSLMIQLGVEAPAVMAMDCAWEMDA